MEELRHKILKGELIKIPNENGETSLLKYFDLIVKRDTREYTGNMHCCHCNNILKYDRKKTGTSSLLWVHFSQSYCQVGPIRHEQFRGMGLIFKPAQTNS